MERTTWAWLGGLLALSVGAGVRTAQACEAGFVAVSGACVHATADLGGNTPGAGSRVGPQVQLTGLVSLAPKAVLTGSSDGSGPQGFSGPSAIGRRTVIGADSTVGADNAWARAVVTGAGLVSEPGVTVGYAAELGSHVTLRSGSVVGNLSVLGDHTELSGRFGRGSRTAAGTASAPTRVLGDVGPDAQIGSGATIGSGARVLRGATVESGAEVQGGARVGRGATVAQGATVEGGAVVRAGGTVCASATLSTGGVVGRGETHPAAGCAPPSIAGQTHTVTLAAGTGNEAVMTFRGIPAGTFEMGCKPGRDDTDGASCTEWGDGAGLHEVTLTRAFWIGEVEVTQRQFWALAGTNPSDFDGSPGADSGLEAPVERVSWHDAAWYANALSAAEGLPACYVSCTGTYPTATCTAPADPYACTGYRLPTEAEWEYAARGDESYPYSGAAAVGDAAWYSGNSSGRTQPTGQKPAGGNGFGLFDMSGNVLEWVNDWSNQAAYPAYPDGRVSDPLGPPTGLYRIRRGGSWSTLQNASAGARFIALPSARQSTLGFRLVRTSP